MGKMYVGMEIRIGKMRTQANLTYLERYGLMKVIGDYLNEDLDWEESPLNRIDNTK